MRGNTPGAGSIAVGVSGSFSDIKGANAAQCVQWGLWVLGQAWGVVGDAAAQAPPGPRAGNSQGNLCSSSCAWKMIRNTSGFLSEVISTAACPGPGELCAAEDARAGHDRCTGAAEMCSQVMPAPALSRYPGGIYCCPVSVFLISKLEGNRSLLLRLPGYINTGGVTQVVQEPGLSERVLWFGEV